MNFWSQRKTSLHTDDQTQSLDIREIRDVRFAQPWKKTRSELAHFGPAYYVYYWAVKEENFTRFWMTSSRLPFAVIVSSINIKTLRSRFFRYFPETTNAKKSRDQCVSFLQFEVHVCTTRPRSRGKWLTARFFACTITHRIPHVGEEILLLKLFRLSTIEFFFIET